MRLAALLSLGGLLLLSLPAHAQMSGAKYYERGDYKRARKVLTDELNTPGLSKQDEATARLYLAAALFATGAEQSALENLEKLAALAPSFKVDPILFPPEFVALAEQARATVAAQRKEEERKRLEAERLEKERREREALAQQQEQPEEPTEEAEASVQLRPDVFGFVDAAGKSVGLGGGLTLGLGMVDVNARVLLGSKVGLGGEVGLLLGSGSVQPRLALRGTAVPGAAVGGGGVVGLRLGASDRLTVLLDVGAEYFSVDDKALYRSFVLTSSAGVGFDLL